MYFSIPSSISFSGIPPQQPEHHQPPLPSSTHQQGVRPLLALPEIQTDILWTLDSDSLSASSSFTVAHPISSPLYRSSLFRQHSGRIPAPNQNNPLYLIFESSPRISPAPPSRKLTNRLPAFPLRLWCRFLPSHISPPTALTAAAVVNRRHG